jgi:hypothetical protein
MNGRKRRQDYVGQERTQEATIIPSLRDGARHGPVPGNKLPGYDHSVPPGQIRVRDLQYDQNLGIE